VGTEQHGAVGEAFQRRRRRKMGRVAAADEATLGAEAHVDVGQESRRRSAAVRRRPAGGDEAKVGPEKHGSVGLTVRRCRPYRRQSTSFHAKFEANKLKPVNLSRFGIFVKPGILFAHRKRLVLSSCASVKFIDN